MELFEQAIEKDPTYALAWAGVSDCYAMLGMDRFAALPPREAYPKAKAAARKALEIDDGLAEAHTSLALRASRLLGVGRARRRNSGAPSS